MATSKHRNLIDVAEEESGGILVIHPKDPSTDFLKYVYASIDATVVTDCNISQDELWELIDAHDKIIMMGHGTPYGLINPQHYGLLIDDSFADLLRGKETISIWCNSDKFFRWNNIHGFHTGMIISECEEQQYVLGKVYLNKREQLDNMIKFAQILGECINDSPQQMKAYVLDNYVGDDPVTEFNRKNIIVL